MNARITITQAELSRRLADPETAEATIAELFEPDLFSARLVPRPHVDLLPEVVEKGLKDKLTGAAIDLANAVCAKRRQDRYYRVIREMPQLPRAVAEGDSWFLHPLLADIVDQLFSKENPRLAILSLAAAGDDLANMWRHNQYLQAVEREEPKFVLLSGGGNDILGHEFPHYLNDYTAGPAGSNPARLLNDNFPRKLRHLRDVYGSMLQDLRRARPACRVVVHGYDYVRPGVDQPDPAKHEHPGKWLGKHLTKARILDPADRDGVVRHMVDSFNVEVLQAVAAENSNALYVDARDAVGTHEWSDEIHPNEKGFNAVALRIYRAITEAG